MVHHQESSMTASAVLLLPSIDGDNAPPASRPLLDGVRKGYGFVPKLFAAFANSPVLLEGYLNLNAAFEKATLTAGERELVFLTASVENACSYCTAAHSTVAKAMLKIPAQVVAAVRSRTPVADRKLDALVNLTRALVVSRGFAAEDAIQRFLAAGYREEQVAEILVGIALKTLSNYTHHLSPVAIDAAFASEA
jgi:uncharacterized peroxidase-related enzyme